MSSETVREWASPRAKAQRRRSVLMGELQSLRLDLNRQIRALQGDWEAIGIPVPENKWIANWWIDLIESRIRASRHIIRETEAELERIEITWGRMDDNRK